MLTFGNVVMDGLYRMSDIPEQNETVLANEVNWTPGGSAVHFAIEAAQLGADVKVLGWVGGDSIGNQLIQLLRQHGVESSLYQIFTAQTPTAITLLNEENEAAVVFSPPIKAQVLPAPQEVALYDVQTYHHMHTHLFLKPYVDSLLLECKRSHVSTSIVIESSLVNEWGRDAVLHSMANATIVFVDELSLELLDDGDTIEARLRALAELGPEIVICIRTEGGCVLVTQEHVIMCSSIQVQASIFVAAAEIFAAAFISKYMREGNAVEAASYAAAASAVTEIKAGVVMNYPATAEIENMLNKHKPVMEYVERGSIK